MDIWLIYRVFKNPDTGITEKIVPIEYCSSEAEARKYTKFFDLQTPVDLRDKISHKNNVTSMYEG